MGCLMTGLLFAVTLLWGALCFGTPMSLPFPAIKGPAIETLAVFNGKGANDKLFWRSAARDDGNQFRLWGLDDGTWYGVTFGMTDADPGILAAFCGYVGGSNNAFYDLAKGILVYANLEPELPTTPQDFMGRVFHVTRQDGKVEDIQIKKGSGYEQSVQGEFVEPGKLEDFVFAFDSSSGKGPSMTHELYKGGPDDKHPATWDAQLASLSQALTPTDMYKAFENSPHVWNPQDIKITPVDLAKWEWECVAPKVQAAASDICFSPTEEESFSWAMIQPAPEPPTLFLFLAPAIFFPLIRLGRIRQRV